MNTDKDIEAINEIIIQGHRRERDKGDKIKAALTELLEGVMQCDLYRDLEAGQVGEGPVVEAHRVLGLDFPPDLLVYLDDDGEDAA